MLSSFLEKVLNLLYPPSEDELVLRKESDVTFLSHYKLSYVDGIYTLSSFQTPIIRAAVHLNKFHNHSRAQSSLALLLTRYLDTIKKDSLLIPIPLSQSRERLRGHNQVTSVLEKLESVWKKQIRTNVLLRTRHTPPQTSLTRVKRLENIKNAFDIKPNGRDILAGAHIILIDDVSTTGSTLKEAKDTLLKYQPQSVTCIALAH